MITSLSKLVADVYKTYSSDSEPHRFRVALVIAASFIISLFGTNIPSNVMPVMATVLSVLTGFAFTAVFSSYSMAASGLPPASNENDRLDLNTLRELGENFKVRSKYFIVCAVAGLVLIMLLTVKLSDSANPFDYDFPIDISMMSEDRYLFQDAIEGLFSGTRVLLTFIAFFVFFECLYTFYRLSETSFAILDKRRKYLDQHID